MIPDPFCPQCETLMLEAERCPACGWQRPPAGGEPGTVLWQVEAPGRLGAPFSRPAAAANLFLVGIEQGGRYESRQGLILALEAASGRERWRYPLPEGRVARLLVTAGGLLLVASEDTRPLGGGENALLALDPATGALVWQFPVPAHSLSAPAVWEELLFFTANDCSGYALALATGRLAWRVEGLPPWSPAPPSAADGRFFIGARAPVVTALSADDGARSTLFRAEEEGNWFPDTPAYADGLLYTTGWDKKIYALDLQRGGKAWEASAGRGATSPAVVGEHLYLGIKDQVADQRSYALYALDRRGGEQVWRFQAGRHLQAPPRLLGDTLLVGSDDHHLYALEAASGRERWRVEVAHKVRCTPARWENSLLFGSEHGDLTAVIWRQAEPAGSLDPADQYRGRQAWELAALSAVLAGDLAGAAADYQRLGQDFKAAQLLARAEAWEQAAPLLLRAERFGDAAQAYRLARDPAGEARALLGAGEFQAAGEIYEELGDHQAAAGAFEKAGLMLQAAICHAQAGNRERAVEVYLALGEVQPAAELCRQAGELARAVQLLQEAGQPQAAAAMLVEAGQPHEGAALLEKHGDLAGAAAIWLQVGDPAGAAQLYQRAGAWEQAADHWVTAGELARAAEGYQRAGQLKQAAQLYVQLDQPEDAIALYRQANAIQEIARLQEARQDWAGAAEAYLGMAPPQPLEAARCYEKLADWDQAAELYRSQGMPAQAARCYEQAGQLGRAAELALEAGDRRGAARLYQAAGDLLRAAELWQALNELDPAIELYQAAGEQGRALALLAQAGAWQRLRQLAAEMGEHEREAQACLALAKGADPWQMADLCLAAGQAFSRAAESCEKSEPERAAQFWEQAARNMEEGYEEEKAAHCRRQANRLRRLPEVAVTIHTVGELVEREFHTLIVRVTNTGYGPARMISARVLSDTFEGDVQATTHIRGLRPSQERELQLRARSQPEVYGDVPLDIEISYLLPDNSEFKRTIRGQVPVRRHDSQALRTPPWTPTGAATPPPQKIYHIYQGDLVEGQKGDSVQIHRGGRQRVALESDRPEGELRCPRCGSPAEPGKAFCHKCGAHLQEPDP